MTDRHGLTVPQADALWDAIVPAGPERPTFVEQYNRACKTVAELLAERPKQDVKGRCPACGWTSLFLGDGGHVTCSRLECPNPSAADQLLHGEQPAPGPAAPQATDAATTARVFAGLHRSAEEDVTRVIALYERWVKAGPPPLGTSMSRWWDKRLVELHDAILPPAEQPTTTTPEGCCGKPGGALCIHDVSQPKEQ